MKLSDFYFADKHAEGRRMPILLPSGEDSGEWLQVMGPDCDAAVRAGRAFVSANFALKEQLEELDAKCKAKNDWTEYNAKYNWMAEDLNQQLAVEVVTGWSFDDAFSKEALAALLGQYRGLAEEVVKYHTKLREELSVK